MSQISSPSKRMSAHVRSNTHSEFDQAELVAQPSLISSPSKKSIIRKTIDNISDS